jgi:uncharacterized membrane protein YqjE
MNVYRIPEQPEERQSMAELFRQLFRDMQELIQQQVQLARTGVVEEVRRLGKATVYGALGVMFLLVTLIFVGNLLMLLFLMGGMNILAATITTVIVFVVLTALFVGLCIKQVRSAQSILKQQEE